MLAPPPPPDKARSLREKGEGDKNSEHVNKSRHIPRESELEFNS